VTTSTDKKYEDLVKAILALLLVVPLYVFEGIVFRSYWHWFVLPLGAPAITLSHAVGLGLFVGFLRYSYKKTDDDYDSLKAIGVTTFVTLYIWGLGAATHAVMT
jgi:hypothetical protein